MFGKPNKILTRQNWDGTGFEEVVSFSNESISGQAPVGTIVTGSDGAFYGLAQVGGYANRGALFRITSPAQIVGINGATLHFDAQHRFGASVIGPPGRPIDVQVSDDLQTWMQLQRITAPQNDPTFVDPSNCVATTTILSRDRPVTVQFSITQRR